MSESLERLDGAVSIWVDNISSQQQQQRSQSNANLHVLHCYRDEGLKKGESDCQAQVHSRSGEGQVKVR